MHTPYTLHPNLCDYTATLEGFIHVCLTLLSEIYLTLPQIFHAKQVLAGFYRQFCGSLLTSLLDITLAHDGNVLTLMSH